MQIDNPKIKIMFNIDKLCEKMLLEKKNNN